MWLHSWKFEFDFRSTSDCHSFCRTLGFATIEGTQTDDFISVSTIKLKIKAVMPFLTWHYNISSSKIATVWNMKEKMLKNLEKKNPVKKSEMNLEDESVIIRNTLTCMIFVVVKRSAKVLKFPKSFNRMFFACVVMFPFRRAGCWPYNSLVAFKCSFLMVLCEFGSI